MSLSVTTPTFEERLFLEHVNSDEDVRTFLGGSELRVFDEVWDGVDVEITGVPDFSTDASW